MTIERLESVRPILFNSRNTDFGPWTLDVDFLRNIQRPLVSNDLQWPVAEFLHDNGSEDASYVDE